MMWDPTDPEAQIGDGVSRPMPRSKTQAFKAVVVLKDKTTLILRRFKAENKSRAQAYLVNRWPGASVQSLEEIK